MIFPLILLALGLGAVAAYEFSPSAHAWIDDHVRAITYAAAAHQTAEAHLEAAVQAIPPGVPVPGTQQQVAQDHAVAAQAATAVAAQKTAQAAQTAQTSAQRATATWMAVLTLWMQRQIQLFAAIQIAQSKSERDTMQKYFDEAVAKIRQAKNELSKLGVRA